MRMDHDLAKELRDAGFPQKTFSLSQPYSGQWPRDLAPDQWPYNPTLEEIIEACGDKFGSIRRSPGNGSDAYAAWGSHETVFLRGSTATIAAAKLWLALHV